MITAMVIGSKPPTCTYVSTVSSAVKSSVTFTAQNIGPTGGGRRFIVVGLVTSGGTLATIPTGITCNGVSMTLLATQTKVLLSNSNSFYGLVVPTGTTADFTITMSNATAAAASIAIWSVKGLRSLTATATSQSSATPAVLNLNVQPRGVVIATAGSAISGTTYTWAGIAQDYVSTTGSASNPARSGASGVSTAGGTPLAVSCTYSSISSPNQRALAIALR